MTSSLVAVAALLTLAAPPEPASTRRSRAIRRVDRAHVVGAPVLDSKARPGVYVWREDGVFRFAVIPRAGEAATTEFQVRASGPVSASSQDGFVWKRQGPQRLLARCRSGQGALRTKGHIKIGRAQRRGRRVRIYLGPLAQRGASTVEIGAFGALKRPVAKP